MTRMSAARLARSCVRGLLILGLVHEGNHLVQVGLLPGFFHLGNDRALTIYRAPK